MKFLRSFAKAYKVRADWLLEGTGPQANLAPSRLTRNEDIRPVRATPQFVQPRAPSGCTAAQKVKMGRAASGSLC